MKLSIVIPTMKLMLVKKCVESVIQYTDLDDTEIIIIANGTKQSDKEGMFDLLKLSDCIKLSWHDEPLGAVKAYNDGIMKATGDYIMLLNDDCAFMPSQKNYIVDALLEPFKDPQVAVTGPMKMKHPQIGPFELKFTPERMAYGFLIFFCAVIPRHIINEIGVLDDTLQCGVDIDYCMRLFDKGYKIVEVPEKDTYTYKDGMRYGSFPFFHQAEGTVHDYYGIEKWHKILEKDCNELNKRYGISLPDGWFGDEDIKVYREIVSLIPENGRMLEIGVWKGKSLCSVADIIRKNNISVWVIDTFEGTKSTELERDLHKEAGIADIEKIFKENIKKFNLDTVTVIRGSSQDLDIVNGFKNEFFDFIFIDGDHMAVGQDIDLWYPKLKNDSVLAGHDIEWHYVKQVVTEKFGKDLVLTGSNIWVKNKEEKRKPVSKEYKEIPKHILELFPFAKLLTSSKNDLIKNKNINVTVYISTKNRYYTTLPMAIAGIVGQTVKPKEFILLDDNDDTKDLRGEPVYGNLFRMLDESGIKWSVIFGRKMGQVINHQLMLQRAEHDIIWRVDDDNFPEANVLETLLDKLLSDDKIGAVASRSVIPGTSFPKEMTSSKIEDIYSKPNLQWTRFNGWEEVDHLHNSFLFRKEAGKHGYHMGLSPVGHREETMFSYGMKLSGWKLFVCGDVTTWHLRQPNGGIRSYNDVSMYEHDEKIFKEWLTVNSKPMEKDTFFAVLDCGLGDHLDFLSLLPEIKLKYKNITLATCFPEVFKDEPVKQISIGEALAIKGNLEDYSVYKYMAERNWKKSIKEAFREMYKI